MTPTQPAPTTPTTATTGSDLPHRITRLTAQILLSGVTAAVLLAVTLVKFDFRTGHFNGDWGVLTFGLALFLGAVTLFLGWQRTWLIHTPNNIAGLLAKLDQLYAELSRLSRNNATVVGALIDQFAAIRRFVEERDDGYNDRIAQAAERQLDLKRAIEAIQANPGMPRGEVVALVDQQIATVKQHFIDLDKRVTVLRAMVGPGYEAMRKEGWGALKQHARAVHRRATKQDEQIETLKAELAKDRKTLTTRTAATITSALAKQDQVYNKRFESIEGQVAEDNAANGKRFEAIEGRQVVATQGSGPGVEEKIDVLTKAVVRLGDAIPDANLRLYMTGLYDRHVNEQAGEDAPGE